MTRFTPKRSGSDDEVDLTIPSMVGSVSTVLGPIDKPSKGKRKRKRRTKRPIGFLANIDKEEPIDD